MITYGIVSHKGGVGKTTTVANLGAALALRHRRVLVIDLDPQAALTTSLRITPEAGRDTGAIIARRGGIPSVIYPTTIDSLDIIPATLDLAVAESRIRNTLAADQILAGALRDLHGYDYTLIDTPPHLGALTFNAIIAAQRLIVPLQCEFLAAKGLADIQQVLSDAAAGGIVRPYRVLLTMYSTRTAHAQTVADEVRRECQTYNSIITRTIRFAYSTVHGVPLVVDAPETPQAQQYVALSREVQEESTHG